MRLTGDTGLGMRHRAGHGLRPVQQMQHPLMQIRSRHFAMLSFKKVRAFWQCLRHIGEGLVNNAALWPCIFVCPVYLLPIVMSSESPVSGPAPAVILVNPQLGENIGTAARAMANFGLSEMHIVDPRDGWPSERAIKAASGADRVIENANVTATCEEAIAPFNRVYATTARPRGMTKQVMTPEQAAADMHTRIANGERVAVMFGRERWGLNNDEVALADVIVTAPVDPKFASINIAQAVLLVGYEWYKPVAKSLGMGTEELPAMDGPGLKVRGGEGLATKQDLQGLFDHLEGELEEAGFFKSPDMRPVMVRNMRNMFQRIELSLQEVRTFRGIIASLTRTHLRNRQRSSEEGSGE
jgi:tRNA/rRNA methyltransferase